MSATTAAELDALAAQAWARLTHPDARGAWPGWALDWLRDSRGCGCGEAFAALCRAARESLLMDIRYGSWDRTPTAAWNAVAVGDFTIAKVRIHDIRKGEENFPDTDTRRWLAWCDRAETAVRILEAIREEVR